MSEQTKRFFGAALSPMPILLSRDSGGGFYPAASLRAFNTISAYCLSTLESVRSCKSKPGKTRRFMGSRLYCYHARTCVYTHSRAHTQTYSEGTDYPLHPPDKIEMYCPYKARQVVAACTAQRLLLPNPLNSHCFIFRIEKEKNCRRAVREKIVSRLFFCYFLK